MVLGVAVSPIVHTDAVLVMLWLLAEPPLRIVPFHRVFRNLIIVGRLSRLVPLTISTKAETVKLRTERVPPFCKFN
jgi:hypothetical protein